MGRGLLPLPFEVDINIFFLLFIEALVDFFDNLFSEQAFYIRSLASNLSFKLRETCYSDLLALLLILHFSLQMSRNQLDSEALILNSYTQELEGLYHWQNPKFIKRLEFLSGMQKWALVQSVMKYLQA